MADDPIQRAGAGAPEEPPELSAGCGCAGQTGIGRRAFLIATSAAVVGGGIWAFHQTEPGLRMRSGPAGSRAAKPTANPDDSPSDKAAAPDDPGAPDLGSEVFPDASGIAIASAADAPVILIARSAWTNQPPDRKHMRIMGGVDKITVHHTAAVASGKDAWKPTVLELDRIEDYHVRGHGWADIGYHFVVDPVGRVWQARPLAYQGAHVKEHNEHNLGTVLMGNFETQRPTAAQLASLTSFLTFLRRLYSVSAKSVFTHGELGQTSCPGKSLQAYMNRLRGKWA